MSLDWKADWPIIAGGGAVVLGLVVVASRGGRGAIVGTGSGDSALSRTQINAETERQKAMATAFQGITNYAIAIEQGKIQLAIEDRRARASEAAAAAQARAVSDAANAQSQSQIFQGILGALPAIFGFFCSPGTAAHNRIVGEYRAQGVQALPVFVR